MSFVWKYKRSHEALTHKVLIITSGRFNIKFAEGRVERNAG